jgi:hypothetical protein
MYRAIKTPFAFVATCIRLRLAQCRIIVEHRRKSLLSGCARRLIVARAHEPTRR